MQKGVIIYNTNVGHRQTNTEATSQSDNPENHRSKNMVIQRLHKKRL
jgi:hypothetical protein